MPVKHKSAKGRFMKKKLIIILIVLLTPSLTFISCDEPEEVDPSLNGTWAIGSNKFTFNNGNYTITEGSFETVKGTYTTKERKVTMRPTEIKLDVTSNFYSKGTLLDTKVALGITEDQINEWFAPKTLTYFVDGNRLFIVNYLGNGDYNYTDIYIRQ